MLLRSPPRCLPHLLRPHYLRALSNAAAAALASPTSTLPPSPAEWTEAPVSAVRPATPDASLFHVSLDLSSHASLLASHVAAGQFLPFRLPSAPYPIFLAISSPPPAASSASGSLPGSFDFLVKRLPGTPSARLFDLRPGDLVRVGGTVVGRGFEVARVGDAREVLVFATGSGISPIRSLIESDFGENEKIDVSLYYGARNLQRMAYQERFDDWQSRGIKIIPVLSRPDDQWTGQRGYVQNAFSRTKKVLNPSSMGAILCGHKQMTEEITRALVADANAMNLRSRQRYGYTTNKGNSFSFTTRVAASTILLLDDDNLMYLCQTPGGHLNQEGPSLENALYYLETVLPWKVLMYLKSLLSEKPKGDIGCKLVKLSNFSWCSFRYDWLQVFVP